MCIPTKLKLEVHDHDDQPCRPRPRKSTEIVEITPGKKRVKGPKRPTSSVLHEHWKCHYCDSFISIDVLYCHRCGKHRHHREEIAAPPPPPPVQSPQQPPKESPKPSLDADTLKQVLIDAGKDIADDCFERAKQARPPTPPPPPPASSPGSSHHSHHRHHRHSSADSRSSCASKGSVHRLRDAVMRMGSQVNLLHRSSHDTSHKIDALGITTAKQMTDVRDGQAAANARLDKDEERLHALHASVRGLDERGQDLERRVSRGAEEHRRAVADRLANIDSRFHAVGDRVRSVDHHVRDAEDRVRDVDDRLRAHIHSSAHHYQAPAPPPPPAALPPPQAQPFHPVYHLQPLPCDHSFDCRCRDRMLSHRIHGLERKADINEAVSQARRASNGSCNNNNNGAQYERLYRRASSNSNNSSSNGRGRSRERSRSRHRYVREVFEDVDSPRERVRILPRSPLLHERERERERWDRGWERDDRMGIGAGLGREKWRRRDSGVYW